MAIIDSIKEVYGDFISGKCVENFKEMPSGKQAITMLKIAGIALLAGIIVGAIGAFGGGLVGSLLGLGFACLVGTCAFAYFTSENHLGEQLEKFAHDVARLVKDSL